MSIMAIDPGPKQSAWVIYHNGEVLGFKKSDNDDLRRVMLAWRPQRLAIEMIASYGMPVGAETFETCLWIGRFIEFWESKNGGLKAELIYRRDVKSLLCHSLKAKDSNVRQALVDRYGGKEKAIGRKATPGPLYGVNGDVWAALGVAITASEGGCDA